MEFDCPPEVIELQAQHEILQRKFRMVRGALERGNMAQARIWAGLDPRLESEDETRRATKKRSRVSGLFPRILRRS